VSNTAVVVVCLPHDTPTDQLAATARTRLEASSTLTNTHPAGYFRIATRLRRSRLLQPWAATAAGGPVRLLDLDAMRLSARDAAWRRWQIWQQVVVGTRPAQPYWHFYDRVRDDPAHYSLAQAQGHYQAQPRIAAMRTYNALPTKMVALPTCQLEAFQAGAHTYAHLAWLSAVPADRLVALDSRHLIAVSDRLTDHLSYLEAAQGLLAGLTRNDQLVALTAR
jgi:hypothetical protein